MERDVGKCAIVELDPSVGLLIEVPMADMRRLAVALRLKGAKSEITPGGTLRASCDERGHLLVPVDFTILSSLSEIEVRPVISVADRSVDGLCPTPFKVNVHRNSWRVNPFLFSYTRRVFLNAAERTITIRRRLKNDPIPVKPAMRLRAIPFYNGVSVETSADGRTEVVFRPVERGPRYALVRRTPLVTEIGSRVTFGFPVIFPAPSPSFEVLPGRFSLESPVVIGIRPDSSLKLPVGPVRAGKRAYTVSIHRALYSMMVVLDSADGTSVASVESAIHEINSGIAASLKDIAPK